jgi:hypothetical protein
MATAISDPPHGLGLQSQTAFYQDRYWFGAQTEAPGVWRQLLFPVALTGRTTVVLEDAVAVRGESGGAGEEAGMDQQSSGREDYVRKVLEVYRKTPGTCGNVRRPDRLLAIQFYRRGIPVKRSSTPSCWPRYAA